MLSKTDEGTCGFFLASWWGVKSSEYPRFPMTVPIPENEEERLAALGRLGILDTEPDASFDKVTRLAKDLFDVSTAAVTLIDQDRQWFKSVCGWDVKETSREPSFCTYAALDDTVMVAENAMEDNRFASNPLVAETAPTRFYAGAPLTVENDVRVGAVPDRRSSPLLWP